MKKLFKDAVPIVVAHIYLITKFSLDGFPSLCVIGVDKFFMYLYI